LQIFSTLKKALMAWFFSGLLWTCRYFMDKDQEKTAGKQNRQPGIEKSMDPRPEFIRPDYKSSGKLAGKVALITGGDSGIGRTISVHFACEGADIAIVYLDEDPDAEITRELVEAAGRTCLLIKGDVKHASFCKSAVKKTIETFGKINILVNNAAIRIPQDDLETLSDEQLEATFDTNILAYFRFSKAALEHMKEGDCIINSSSVSAYRSAPDLIDYPSTKGAIITFTQSLAANLAKKKIRVNGVVPHPFGMEASMQRAGQPFGLGPAYVFLASDDASYITGQVIRVSGEEVMGG
jgi:NAD(P)-dependent dehydrogenase (short-subunit alcohol dehydrogenase family)